MRNLTQTIFTSRRIFLNKSIATIGLMLILMAGNISFAQNGIIGTGFGTNEWSTIDGFSAGAGPSRIFTATPNGTGNQYFRLVRNWGGDFTQFGPFGCVDTDWTNPGLVYGMSVCGGGAFFINCPNTTDNYVFKTPDSDTSMDLLYFRVQGAVRTVSAVTQSPLAASVTQCRATTITATLDGALSEGQAIYMRYTKDGYATSTVVKLTGSGTTYTGTIPSGYNTAGANVSYYVFTSGTTTPSVTNADFFTINLNNNGGFNYSYTVAAGGATTYVPDNNFEQALIDLNLDCAIDGQVFTSNISGVTELNVESLGITDLTGIEAFSSLQDLYCADNTLTSLNVSMLSNLRYLDCQSNALTSLNITGLINLTQMVCWHNNLTTLDLSSTPNLVYLDCDDNAFTSLDVSKLPNLNQFYCSGNQVTILDVRGLTNLANFECKNNSSLTCILVDDVAAAVFKMSEIDPDNVPPSPFWKKDLSAAYSYCACDLPITWDGNVWSNGTGPISTQAAIIAGTYSVAANISACTLTIKNGANVTIPSGFNVTLNAPLTVETGGSFTLSNYANLVQTNKNSVNSGDINVERDSSPLFRSDYTMWSSPVSGIQTLGGFSPLTVANRFYEYNTTTDFYNAVPSTAPFGLAKGYLIRMPNTWVDYVVSPPSTPLSWTGTFTGTPNNGDVVYTMSSAFNGYNAVGNPYPSTLNIDSFINGNTANIDGTLWFWRKTNDASNPVSYSTCTLAGITSGNTHTYPDDNFISVGQGFIVKAKAGQTALNFNNTMRVANNTNQFFKTRQIERNRIWLNLSNTATPINQMMLAYMAGATQDIDAAIDGRYFNDSQMALNSLISSEEFAIQGRALPFDGTDIVPLAFKTNLAGEYTIAIDHVDGLFLGSQDIFLKDNNTGTETNLKAGAYTFTAVAGVDNARFSLKYQKTLKVDAPSFNDNSVTVYKNKGTLYVNSGAVAIANIKVFDIQGRLIAEQKNVKANSATINNLKATQQVLIVKVTGQDKSVVNKKVVN